MAYPHLPTAVNVITGKLKKIVLKSVWENFGIEIIVINKNNKHRMTLQ